MLAALSSACYGGVVTSLPGGTVVPIPADNDDEISGPVVFDGITWTATGGVGYFGFTSTWGFGTNGEWTGALGPMAGVDDETDSMTFAPSSPVSGIGGFLNWATPDYGTATIAVYDTSDVLIESDVLSFSTGGADDTGQFLGFSEGSADIGYFTLTGAYIGITDLTVSGEVSAVPEPGAVGLTLIGLGLLVSMRKRMVTRRHSAQGTRSA